MTDRNHMPRYAAEDAGPGPEPSDPDPSEGRAESKPSRAIRACLIAFGVAVGVLVVAAAAAITFAVKMGVFQ